ncbi:MAG: helix-turn-helix domain-containing protein [Tractidigestivibacter sp.]|jgi:transcriptional regulator with XRE-family HTH domain|uniref:helix-turn-helix domain-containing protein n=1 Tax=Tractidigestivibacter sp. TaxID=2847320 RepID=UPI003D8A9328
MYEISNRLVGKVLRGLRRKAHLSQIELADRLQVPQSLISKIETGERALHVNELYSYADALQTTPKRIIDAIGNSYRLPNEHAQKELDISSANKSHSAGTDNEGDR